MKKSSFFIGFLFIVFLNNSNAQMLNKVKLALDAGSGGKDLGVVNTEKNLISKNVNMEVCKLVSDILNKTNEFDIIYTRKNDEYVELSERAFIAAENQVDLFFSIECYQADKEYKGAEVWVLNNTNDQNSIGFSKKVNNQIISENGYELAYEDYDLKKPNKILESIKLDNKYINNSNIIANEFVKNLQKERGLTVNPIIKNGYLLLLHQVGVPSFKAFIGNVNNEDDAFILNDFNYKNKIANALAKSIIEYKKQYFDRNFEPISNSKDLISKLKINLKEILKTVHSDMFFDYGKSHLKLENYIELDKIAIFLKKFNNFNLEVICHTDARSSNEFNLELSQKRAEVISNYIIKKGISKDRLKAIGMGEANLLNNCKEGVKCAEIEHQLNRRAEFILIEN